jgi:hypothetical protein
MTKFNRLKNTIAGLALATCSIFSNHGNEPYRPSRKDDEEWVWDEESRKMVPKKLVNMGIKSLNTETADAVQGLYLNLRNHREGRKLSCVPANIAFKAQNTNLYVFDGPNAGIYNPDNIYHPIDKSRTIFEGAMRKDLSKISGQDYKSLPEELREIVHQATETSCL